MRSISRIWRGYRSEKAKLNILFRKKLSAGLTPNCNNRRATLFSPHVAAFPAGFIAPCLPTKTDKPPSGSDWLHEIKHDGFRVTGSAFYRFALACGEARSS